MAPAPASHAEPSYDPPFGVAAPSPRLFIGDVYYVNGLHGSMRNPDQQGDLALLAVTGMTIDGHVRLFRVLADGSLDGDAVYVPLERATLLVETGAWSNVHQPLENAETRAAAHEAARYGSERHG